MRPYGVPAQKETHTRPVRRHGNRIRRAVEVAKRAFWNVHKVTHGPKIPFQPGRYATTEVSPPSNIIPPSRMTLRSIAQRFPQTTPHISVKAAAIILMRFMDVPQDTALSPFARWRILRTKDEARQGREPWGAFRHRKGTCPSCQSRPREDNQQGPSARRLLLRCAACQRPLPSFHAGKWQTKEHLNTVLT